MKKQIVSAKNIVRRNQTKILATVAVVTTTIAVVQQIGLQQHNEFLKDHDLFDTYYAMDEE